MTAGAGIVYLDWLLDGGATAQLGTVYLLHFLEPIGNPDNSRAMAQHYIGWSPDAPKRFAKHTAGQGARIVAAVMAAGIGFEVAATWPGDRRLERRLKRWHNARKLCPICRGER